MQIDYDHGEKIPATDLFTIYSNWASNNNEYTWKAVYLTILSFIQKNPPKPASRS